MEIFTWISANWVSILSVMGGVVAVASMIAQMTPTQTDDNWVAKISQIVNFLALNWGNDKKPTA